MESTFIPKANVDDSLIAAAEKGLLYEVNMLLEQKADPNAGNDEGNTALHAAAMNGHIKVCQRLLAAGAGINEINFMNNTALHLAVIAGKEEVKALLLKRELILQ